MDHVRIRSRLETISCCISQDSVALPHDSLAAPAAIVRHPLAFSLKHKE